MDDVKEAGKTALTAAAAGAVTGAMGPDGLTTRNVPGGPEGGNPLANAAKDAAKETVAGVAGEVAGEATDAALNDREFSLEQALSPENLSSSAAAGVQRGTETLGENNSSDPGDNNSDDDSTDESQDRDTPPGDDAESGAPGDRNEGQNESPSPGAPETESPPQGQQTSQSPPTDTQPASTDSPAQAQGQHPPGQQANGQPSDTSDQPAAQQPQQGQNAPSQESSTAGPGQAPPTGDPSSSESPAPSQSGNPQQTDSGSPSTSQQSSDSGIPQTPDSSTSQSSASQPSGTGTPDSSPAQPVGNHTPSPGNTPTGTPQSPDVGVSQNQPTSSLNLPADPPPLQSTSSLDPGPETAAPVNTPATTTSASTTAPPLPTTGPGTPADTPRTTAPAETAPSTPAATTPANPPRSTSRNTDNPATPDSARPPNAPSPRSSGPKTPGYDYNIYDPANHSRFLADFARPPIPTRPTDTEPRPGHHTPAQDRPHRTQHQATPADRAAPSTPAPARNTPPAAHTGRPTPTAPARTTDGRNSDHSWLPPFHPNAPRPGDPIWNSPNQNASRPDDPIWNSPHQPDTPPRTTPTDPDSPGSDPTGRSLDDLHAHHAERTPAGISHHRGDPSIGDLPHRVPRDPHRFTADVHLTPDGHARVGDRVLTPEQYGDLIRRSHWDGATPVRLIGCDASTSGFADRLARDLGVDVLAPTAPAWTDIDGNLYTTGVDTGPSGTRNPRIPPDGAWNTHHPDGTTTPAGTGHPPSTRTPEPGTLDTESARDRSAFRRPQDPHPRVPYEDLTGGRPSRTITPDDPLSPRRSRPFGRDRSGNPVPLEPDTAYRVTDRSGRDRGLFITGPDGTIQEVVTDSGERRTRNTEAQRMEGEGFNPDLRRPFPDAVYTVDNRFIYSSDEHGRVVRAEGSLDLTASDDRRRGPDQTRIGHHGQAEYAGINQEVITEFENEYGRPPTNTEVYLYQAVTFDGGHLFATEFNGPGEAINMVPMLTSLNRDLGGDNTPLDNWRRLEGLWGEILGQDPPPEVNVRIELEYDPNDGGSRTPIRITAAYTVQGVQVAENCYSNLPPRMEE